MSVFGSPTIIRPGTPGKPDPFTVLVIANPVLEAPEDSGVFIADPIIANRPGFDACVAYVDASLFGGLPNLREPPLQDPAILPAVRFMSLYQSGVPLVAQYSFAANDDTSELLIARRDAIRAFLAAENIVADVVYAISGSKSHSRASAFFTTDDDAGPGNPFVLDGATLHHRHRYVIPGAIAMHYTAKSLTAVHEFQHAVSSYSNGQVVDLYVDWNPAFASGTALNKKAGRPIPANYGTANAHTFLSDPTRGPLTYPPSWGWYHCEIHDPTNPAIMDNYHSAPGGISEVCLNDKITRMFVRDRVLAEDFEVKPMEPLKPKDKTEILESNPAADPADIEEYERLLSQRFTRDPSQPVAEGIAAAPDDLKARLKVLHKKLFPGKS